MPNSDHRAKVTIEDLLRLKRGERPAEEFWSGFERELRQKQLSALLEKRPWWHGAPKLFARRAYLPVGATAILAFTLVSVRFYAPVQVGQIEVASPASAPSLKQPGEVAPELRSGATVSSPLVNRTENHIVALASRPVSSAGNDAPAGLGLTPAASLPAESPSARSIAANLAHLEQSEPELISSVLGNRLSSPARVLAEPAPAVEFASITAGTSSKRSRLLAHFNDHVQSNPEPSTVDAISERISRRLADTDYTERFSRIGLKGDQVSLKF